MATQNQPQNSDDSDHEKSQCMTQVQQEKLNLIIDQLKPHCNDKSEHRDLRQIGQALLNGHELQGNIILVGKTNYSYRLFIEDCDVQLFAKVAFPHPLWSQSKSFDLGRQKCEFELMKEFSQKLGGKGESPVVTPYLLLDNVKEDISILITEWAPANETWCYQFIEGRVDRRVVKHVAETFATIHLSDFDPNMNYDLRQEMGKIGGGLDVTRVKDVVLDAFFQQENPKDEFVAYLQEMGREKFVALRSADSEGELECLAHADAFVFNCLVEATRRNNGEEGFGKTGRFVLCDWEFARPHVKGFDMGTLFSVPLMCAYFHAGKGNVDKSLHIIECLKELWDFYMKALVRDGKKDEDYLAESLRGCLGHCGNIKAVPLYMFGLFGEFMDKDGLSQEESKRIMSRLGISGLQFMEVAYAQDKPGVDSLLQEFEKITTSHIHILTSISGLEAR